MTNAKALSLTKSPPFTFDEKTCYSSSDKTIRAYRTKTYNFTIIPNILLILPKVKSNISTPEYRRYDHRGRNLQQSKAKPADARFCSQCGTSPDNPLARHACRAPPSTQENRNSEGFDDMLSRAIDKTLRYVLGDINTAVIYSYLEKRGCRSNEIPAKPSEFSTELRKVLGSGRGQILGAASVLEETIVENLSAELKIYLDNPRLAQFADNIKKLREAYNVRNKNTQQIQCENSNVTIMNHVSAKSKEKTELFESLIRKSSKEKGR